MLLMYIRLENFLDGDYNDLDVKDHVVVDIGAGIGDTVIYFALRGARKVIALEPYPALYSIALRNIEANNVGNRVQLLNAGLGNSDYYACASYEEPSYYILFK
ncbi:MAG: FkbM family methyltransferase [Infirmifilum sp.]